MVAPCILKNLSGEKHGGELKLEVGEVLNSTMANFSLLANLFCSKYSNLLNYRDW